ncbi:hypothetical protein V6582_05915 [Agrobacterium vitis]|uniref:hypothetical protein n=1 Tax=Agrobacterium vitis TaxID=373 RepID=UPI0012E97450|nr:hypothetical protein [Agrobacterium vitis]MVA24555.1 hypothetical protein [Agrobacterium vitis]
MHIKNVHISGAKVGIKTEGPITGKFENVRFTDVEQPYDISGASKIEMSGTRVENSPRSKSAGSTTSRIGYTGRNGPPLPALCPQCKSIFPSKSYDIGSSEFYGFDNEEICQNPECGYEHAKVATGLFNLAKEVIEVLKAEPLTYAMLAAISSAATDFLEEHANEVTTVARIKEQNPKLADIFCKFLNAGGAAGTLVTLWFMIFPTHLTNVKNYLGSSEPNYRRTSEIERVCLESFGEASTCKFIITSGGDSNADINGFPRQNQKDEDNQSEAAEKPSERRDNRQNREPELPQTGPTPKPRGSP